MLFQPEAHVAPADEPWSAERARTAIASIVADAESAFDDGWPTHPQDAEDEYEARARFRGVYLGGAGCVRPGSVGWLEGRGDTEGLWMQQLNGQSGRHLGPAHGFAGCVLALGDVADVSETLQRFAVEEDGLVNWPPLAGMRLDANGDGQIRTQWCHGAPGIVATLAHVLDEELAVAGGELAWRPGPLRKGASLCHGTAGNGYAFLALLERTGDERWLARARTFAMHAAGQVEQSRSDYGRGRYTLWTGDLGTALYLADCTDGGGELPLP